MAIAASWIMLIASVAICTGEFRSFYYSKDKMASPGKAASRVDLSGCTYSCELDSTCTLAPASHSDRLCAVISRLMGKDIPHYTELKPPTQHTTCVHGPYGRRTLVGPVNEESLYLGYGPISGVKLWAGGLRGTWISGIKFRYGRSVWGQVHGTKEGATAIAPVYWGTNRITEIVGRHGAIIDKIGFKTNTGVVYGPYGGNGGKPFPVITSHQLLYAIVWTEEGLLGSIQFVFSCAT